MTFRPHPVPAWAVLAASGCLSAALPQVMFLQRKGQVIMTIELLDTEEAQTEDPVEVQVRTGDRTRSPAHTLGPRAAAGSARRVAPTPGACAHRGHARTSTREPLLAEHWPRSPKRRWAL